MCCEANVNVFLCACFDFQSAEVKTLRSIQLSPSTFPRSKSVCVFVMSLISQNPGKQTRLIVP